jgi:hypothetical protein
LLCGVLLAPTLLVLTGTASGAADVRSVARTYHDGLDSRHSAAALVGAAKSVGYTGQAYTGGRASTDAWNDGLSASVLGYFGHANAGVFQVQEGANDASDQYIGAGVDTDVVSIDSNFRWWNEYIPFVDADHVRLAVLAGCYTANSHAAFGDFEVTGTKVGMDAVVAFPGLVYYPSTCTSCVYSGNYFWDRFSTYAKAGNTVSVSLSRARTDLVAKEGSAGGWQAYRVTGSVSSPGSVKLTPPGDGELLTSRPTGVEPYQLDDLTVVGRSHGTSPMGATIEHETAEGITFRRLESTGALLDVAAPASVTGADGPMSQAAARGAALEFAADHGIAIGTDMELTSDVTDHGDEQHLAAFSWRSTTPRGLPGSRQVDMEVDLRTGSLTYVAVTEAPSSGEFAVSQEQARDLVAAMTPTHGAEVTVLGDVWHRPRWTVTVDRGLDGPVPDVERFQIDAATGEVLSRTTT